MLLRANGGSIRESTELFVSGRSEESAIAWLKFRNQRSNMSVPRSIFHLIEAKRFAQLDPTVGRTTQIVIIPPQGDAKIFQDDGVTTMSKWRDSFGLKNTEQLDSDEAQTSFMKDTGMSLPPMQSASRKSAPEL